MLKEAKNIDFYTTGKQPSEKDFLRISEWIRKNKEKEYKKKLLRQKKRQTSSSVKKASSKVLPS